MFAYTDQAGRKVLIPAWPERIISIVPSQTELLYDLGLEEEVIGITKFCVHPRKWTITKTRIGGTKKLKLDLIRKLAPDLILANKEENLKEDIQKLEKDYPVWVSAVHDIGSAYEMMEQIGIITEKEDQAKEIIQRIKNKLSPLSKFINLSGKKPLKTCYLIWKDPHMTVGRDTFIHSMIERCGFENIYSDQFRYPEIVLEELKNKNCELLLLSSEPYPFKQKHIDLLKNDLPGTKIILVDGEMFSWYGSRMLKAAEYFMELRKKLVFDDR